MDLPSPAPLKKVWPWLMRLGLLLGALCIYGYMAGDWLARQSITPYFPYLADAFLHGQLYLGSPPATYDLIQYAGHWYVAQQPLPALLMTPLVALRGPGISDVAFGVGLGALNVALCDLVLARTQPDLSQLRRWLLALFFGFGTAHFTLSVLGTVWFVGQVAAVTFTWGFIWAVASRRWTWAGLMLGLVLLARPSIVPGGLCLAAGWAWLGEDNAPNETPPLTTFKTAARRFLPLFVLCGLLLAGYNLARFGSPFDFGYAHLQDAPNLRARRQAHGQFSLAFLPENLYLATIKPLGLRPACLTDPGCGVLEADLAGNGLLWTSPVLLYMVLARGKTRQKARRVWLLALSVGVVVVPSLLYHNTGSAQFGYRFALDAMPFMLVLCGNGARRSPAWVLVGLVGLAIGIHTWGTIWFINQLGL